MGARGGEGGGGSGEGKLASDLEERDRGDLVDVKTWKPDARPPSRSLRPRDRGEEEEVNAFAVQIEGETRH